MLLGPRDALPHRPRRIAVAGVSGSGKTTLARRIAVVTGAPHVELDALYHGPGWVPRPSFLDDVERFTREPAWVTERQYAAARAVLLARADLLVWLDLPTAQTMAQVVGRTVRRRWRDEVLWNGNREGPLTDVFRDPDHVVRWAWATRARYRDLPAEVAAERAAAHLPELPVVRLRSHTEGARWLAGALAEAVRAGTDPPAR